MTSKRNQKVNTLNKEESPSTEDETESISQELLNALNNLGLPNYEARAFAALSALGRGVAREIAEIASIPRARVYDTLRELEEKGMVSKTSGRGSPHSYGVTLDPAEAIEKLADQARSQLDTARKFSVNQLSQLKKLASKRKQDLDSPYEIHFNWGNILPVLEKMISEADESIVLLLPSRVLRRILPNLAQKQEEILDFVVVPSNERDIRLLAEHNIPTPSGRLQQRNNDQNLGESLIDAQLYGLVVDHSKICLIIHPESKRPSGLIFSDSKIANFFENLAMVVLSDLFQEKKILAV